MRPLVVGALVLAVQASCSCGPEGCPKEGFRLRYRFNDVCATGVITATTLSCRPLPDSYDSAAGEPSYDWGYQVFDAGGIPPAPPDSGFFNGADYFAGFVFAPDGGPWPLSDGGVALGSDGKPAHFRQCLMFEALDGGNGTFSCTSYGGDPSVSALNTRQLDRCDSIGTLESRETVRYFY